MSQGTEQPDILIINNARLASTSSDKIGIPSYPFISEHQDAYIYPDTNVHSMVLLNVVRNSNDIENNIELDIRVNQIAEMNRQFDRILTMGISNMCNPIFLVLSFSITLGIIFIVQFA